MSEPKAKTGPGRPEIGAPVNIRLGDELLVAVDAVAKQRGTSRAETIREILVDRLLTGGLDTAMMLHVAAGILRDNAPVLYGGSGVSDTFVTHMFERANELRAKS